MSQPFYSEDGGLMRVYDSLLPPRYDQPELSEDLLEGNLPMRQQCDCLRTRGSSSGVIVHALTPLEVQRSE